MPDKNGCRCVVGKWILYDKSVNPENPLECFRFDKIYIDELRSIAQVLSFKLNNLKETSEDLFHIYDIETYHQCPECSRIINWPEIAVRVFQEAKIIRPSMSHCFNCRLPFPKKEMHEQVKLLDVHICDDCKRNKTKQLNSLAKGEVR